MNDSGHTLAALVDDLGSVERLPLDVIPALLARLSAIQTALAARLLGAPPAPGAHDAAGDTLLDVDTAAARLGTTADWLYRHASKLPFTVRLGPRQLRFSAAGLGRWIEVRRGR